jgi:hypothetical protein
MNYLLFLGIKGLWGYKVIGLMGYGVKGLWGYGVKGVIGLKGLLG